MGLIMLYMEVGVVFNKWRGVGLIMLYMEVGVASNEWRGCESDNVVYAGGGCLQ